MKKVSRRSRSNNISLVCGIIGAVLFFFVMGLFGDPYDIIHRIDVFGIIPPIWLWKTTTTVWGFLIGYAAGRIISDMYCEQSSVDIRISAYRGGLFYIAAFFLSLSHYPLFFNAEKIFISLIVALISAILTAICGAIWSRVEKGSSLIMFGYAFWLFYVVFVNFSIFFRI